MNNEQHEWYWKGYNDAKKSLAQPAVPQGHEQEPVIGTKTWFEDGKVVTQHLTAKDIYKDPEQPEQEPVAWMHNHIKGNVIAHRPADIDRHPEHWTALYPEPKPCPTCEALARTVMLDQTSHDTTPPKREWVGLTDEEVKKIAYNTAEQKVAKNIEAKLKEKNDC